MKVFLSILILIFSLQSLIKADDIRDFEIEGISIGDSLLDYFSDEEIKKSIHDKLVYPASDKFFSIDPIMSYKNYDNVVFHIKKNDKKYKIYSLKGSIYYNNKIDECFNKKEEILNDISSVLKNLKEDTYTNDFNGNAGKSIAYISDFDLDNGILRVWCSEWDKEHKISKNFSDSLNVGISSRKFLNWLNEEAYN